MGFNRFVRRFVVAIVVLIMVVIVVFVVMVIVVVVIVMVIMVVMLFVVVVLMFRNRVFDCIPLPESVDSHVNAEHQRSAWLLVAAIDDVFRLDFACQHFLEVEFADLDVCLCVVREK
jgi:fatty acid desaturase